MNLWNKHAYVFTCISFAQSYGVIYYFDSLIAILILIILYDYILIPIFSFPKCNLVEHSQDVENLMKHKYSL